MTLTIALFANSYYWAASPRVAIDVKRNGVACSDWRSIHKEQTTTGPAIGLGLLSWVGYDVSGDAGKASSASPVAICNASREGRGRHCRPKLAGMVQNAALAALKLHHEATGEWMSSTDLARVLGYVHDRAVYKLLKLLHEEGYVEFAPGTRRVNAILRYPYWCPRPAQMSGVDSAASDAIDALNADNPFGI